MTAISAIVKKGALGRPRRDGRDDWRDTTETLAIAAHELRSPLATTRSLIKALSITLDRASDPNEIKDFVNRIERQVARADKLLVDILDLNNLFGPGQESRAEPVNILEAFERAKSAMVGSSLQDVRADIPDGLRVWADAPSLEQVFINLLNNAARYGGPTLEVGVVPRYDKLEISIADDGEGVPKGLLAKLFQPFARGANAQGAPGSGLGLAISREITRVLGGDLYYEPRIPHGARFVVVLRAAGNLRQNVFSSTEPRLAISPSL